MSDQDSDIPYYPRGPALLYVHSEDTRLLHVNEARTISRVDTGSSTTIDSTLSDSDNRRERQILRSLLEHALWLLDQEEGR